MRILMLSYEFPPLGGGGGQVVDGLTRELVCDTAGAGVFAPAENPTAIARAVMELTDNAARRDQLGGAGRAWMERHGSRKVHAMKYLEILKDLVAATPPTTSRSAW